MKRPMTPRGYNSLRSELRRLKSTRPELARAIEIARGHGDLSENGDYDAAKEKSGMTEAKIRDIEAKLATAEIIDPSRLGEPGRVVFGVSVKISDVDSGDEKTLSIVGADESDIEKGWISCESPLGRALIGKELNDIAKVTIPGGTREYEIVEIFVDYQDDSVEEEKNLQ
jgi:transcription elongation factor GreA